MVTTIAVTSQIDFHSLVYVLSCGLRGLASFLSLVMFPTPCIVRNAFNPRQFATTCVERVLFFSAVVYSVRGVVFLLPILFSVTVGELMLLIAVGILLQQKRRGLLPPFWPLSLFCVPRV